MLGTARFFILAFALICVSGCLEGKDEGPAPLPDMGQTWKDGPLSPDSPGMDIKQPSEGSCAIGTPDHCSKCGHKCPGKDDAATRRRCDKGTCSIACKGDYYDVNGSVSDGCEYKDPFPDINSQNSAKNLGSANDCHTVGIGTIASLPSDERYHDKPPHGRKLSEPKWFKLNIIDKTICVFELNLTLDLVSLPPGAHYEMMAEFVCKSGKTVKLGTKSGKGASSIVMKPGFSCGSGSDDSGTLFVRARKFNAPTVHSTNWFRLNIKL